MSIVMPRHCEICGETASGKIRVELLEYRTASQAEVRYSHGITHARCKKHQFGISNVSVYEGYDYVELSEGEVLREQ